MKTDSSPTRDVPFQVSGYSCGYLGSEHQDPCLWLLLTAFCTQLLWTLLQVVGPKEGKPTFLSIRVF